jgi:prolipoprotein diacylglyceryltransferase
MNPVAFNFLGLDFRWYGIIIASLAFLYFCRIKDLIVNFNMEVFE